MLEPVLVTAAAATLYTYVSGDKAKDKFNLSQYIFLPKDTFLSSVKKVTQNLTSSVSKKVEEAWLKGKKEAWWKNNLPHLETTYYQGDWGEDAIFHQGLCTAIIYRVISSLCKKPLQPIRELLTPVNARDRVVQATHHLHTTLRRICFSHQERLSKEKVLLQDPTSLPENFRNENLLAKLQANVEGKLDYLKGISHIFDEVLPQKTCKRDGVQLTRLTPTTPLSELSEVLKKFESDPYVMVFIRAEGKGHALGIQQDEAHQIFRFMTSTAGSWSYSSKEELLKQFVEFINVVHPEYTKFNLFSCRSL